eukprot:3940861-Rhodomonas_salina.1
MRLSLSLASGFCVRTMRPQWMMRSLRSCLQTLRPTTTLSAGQRCPKTAGVNNNKKVLFATVSCGTSPCTEFLAFLASLAISASRGASCLRVKT